VRIPGATCAARWSSPPLTLRIDAEGAFAWLRFEAFARAVMPHSVAVRHAFTTGEYIVHNQEAHYAGGLAEARPLASLVAGLFAAAVRAVGGPLEEVEARAGLFATGEPLAAVRLLGRLERVAATARSWCRGRRSRWARRPRASAWPTSTPTGVRTSRFPTAGRSTWCMCYWAGTRRRAAGGSRRR
jgi:hypothetical protein